MKRLVHYVLIIAPTTVTKLLEKVRQKKDKENKVTGMEYYANKGMEASNA